MPTPDATAWAKRLRESAEAIGRPLRIMEVCGTHTHVIGKAGLRALFPEQLELVSGPGCPVCVTSQRDIERMLFLARLPGVTVCTFGDMLRVPGTTSSLERERSRGADVRVVYSPLDALELARANPGREIVFLALGFETTAPAVAATILQAAERVLPNLSFLVCHKRIVPVMAAVLDGANRLDAFLTPGHVSVIIGAEAFAPLAAQYHVPCVATGFEPNDVLEGIAMALELIAEGRAGSFVQYTRAIRPGGNVRARAMLDAAFETCDAEWRGLGVVPGSGSRPRPAYARLDAARRYEIPEPEAHALPGCQCGEVLRGRIRPQDCPLFGRACTPRAPVGPCMVSSEGSCAARYKYG